MIWGFSKSYVILTILSKGISLISSFLILYFNKLLINEISNTIINQTLEGSSVLTIIIITLSLDMLAVLLLSMFQYHMGKQKIKYDDKMIIFIALSISGLDMTYYDDPNHYNQTNLAYQYSNSIMNIFNKVIDFIFSIITLLIAITLVSSISASLFILVLLSVIPSFLVRKHINQRNFQFSKNTTQDKRYTDYLASLMLNKSIIREMQVFNTQQYFKNKTEEYQEKYRHLRISNSIKNARCEFAIMAFEKSISFIQQVLLIMSIIKKALTIGDYSYIGGVLAKLKSSFNQVLILINELQIADKQYQDFSLTINRKPYISSKGSINVPTNPNIIEFKNVSFKYPNTNKYALHNVSFKYAFNDRIALVGPNGSGKSTLIKLLLRFYDPSEGAILLNGIDVKEYNLQQYRSIYSVMFQEPLIYGLSIEENIALCDPKHIDADKIKEILNMLKFHPDIDYKRYYGREFSPDGYVFSLGEQQKLFSARTLYHSRNLFILDEPAASMDALSEHEFFDALNDYTDKCGLIYITHRYGILRNMDKILVLDKGELIEQGTHMELITNQGLYSQIYELQEGEFNENHGV